MPRKTATPASMLPRTLPAGVLALGGAPEPGDSAVVMAASSRPAGAAAPTLRIIHRARDAAPTTFACTLDIAPPQQRIQRLSPAAGRISQMDLVTFDAL